MKKFCLALILSAMAMQLCAKENDEFMHNRFAFSGTLSSSDTYSLEMSYHYMFCRYLGAGGALGFWSTYFEEAYVSGNYWHTDSEYENMSNLYLRPSLLMHSPGLRFKATTWSLFAEPGLMLNIPYRRMCIDLTHNWPDTDYKYISTNKGQWFAVELRLGISAEIGPCVFTAGYFMSNFDIYSQARHLSYEGISFKDFFPSEPFMQGAFLTLSYCF